MSEPLILPVGHHRLDPSPDRDAVQCLLRSLWTDLVWLCEHSASLAANWGAQPDVAMQDLGYLRNCTDDALQALARLIELLQAGHAADPSKPFHSGSSSMPSGPVASLGSHPLDPAPDVCAVRHFIDRGKALLLRTDRDRLAFESIRDSDPAGAAALLAATRDAARDARQHLSRLSELVLAGHAIDPTKAGPPSEGLRLFARRTEEDWLACDRLYVMCRMIRPLDYGVRVRFSRRKWRLFAAACIRRVCHVFRDPRTLAKVDAAERFADGSLSQEELDRISKLAYDQTNPDCSGLRDQPLRAPAACLWQALNLRGGFEAGRASGSAGWARAASGRGRDEESAQKALLRDVFGHPFREIVFADDWRAFNDGAAAKLARLIHDERSFDLMPLLGDALEDAGCVEPAILEHCRGAGPHVRGCWVVDGVLGLD
jgi:hypothetical protein